MDVKKAGLRLIGKEWDKVFFLKVVSYPNLHKYLFPSLHEEINMIINKNSFIN